MFPCNDRLRGQNSLRPRSWQIWTLFIVTAFLSTAVAPAPAAAQGSGNFVINRVQLTSFSVVNNVLHAQGTVTGTLAGLPFTTNITNFALQLIPDDPGTPAVECSVLDLELAPIHLALLGLFVDTSAICLEITATEGGGLLGDLLCGLAGGGPGGLGIPIIPTGNLLSGLIGGLVDLLNGALGSGLTQAQGGSSVCTGQCEVLDLTLGPLDLSLLGLNVSLDNCNNGPVEVCISASRGSGNLGDLLRALTGPQLGNLTLADITRLIGRALQLAPGGFTNREIADLRALLLRLVSA
jgi:hypothetical protein